MISPTTFFVLITTIIDSFKVFGTVNLMTQGGPNGDATSVIVFNIYQNAFRYYKMGYASAMSWVLFAMVFMSSVGKSHEHSSCRSGVQHLSLPMEGNA